MCFSGRLKIATGFFLTFRYDSVCPKCYGYHVFLAEVVEFSSQVFQCGVFTCKPIGDLLCVLGFCFVNINHHHTPMCLLAGCILRICHTQTGCSWLV